MKLARMATACAFSCIAMLLMGCPPDDKQVDQVTGGAFGEESVPLSAASITLDVSKNGSSMVKFDPNAIQYPVPVGGQTVRFELFAYPDRDGDGHADDLTKPGKVEEALLKSCNPYEKFVPEGATQFQMDFCAQPSVAHDWVVYFWPHNNQCKGPTSLATIHVKQP